MASSKGSASQDFVQRMDENRGILFKVATTYCWDQEDQKDLIQEISLQAWRSFPRYNPKFKFSTWLYRVALNVAISNLRKQKSRSPTTETLTEYIDRASEEAEEKESQIKALYHAIAEQSPINRAIILLFLEEKSYVEIAEIIGISQTNVATKLSRIKNEIKEKLNPSSS
ncbi:RNA polymerase sigma factor [Algoriphagus namhaensis]